MEKTEVIWAPQPGPQDAYVNCPVYEVFYGGARGGGKTDGTLGKYAIKAQTYGPGFNALYFRKELPSLDDAIDIIEDVSRSPSGWGQAARVSKAAKLIKKVLNDRKGEGTREREETETLIQLQRQKSLVPKIFQLIHDSIPVATGALGKARTPTEIREAIAGGAPPRGQREQVFIESVAMQYEPNLNAYGDWTESLTEVEPRISDDKGVLPGFEIRIKCRTPHLDGAKFIADRFMDPLREASRQPGNGFFFDRVWLISGSTLEAAEESGSTGTRDSGFGEWRGGRSDSTPAATPGSELVDPVTLEPAQDDWLFEIWLDVILEDYPELEEEDSYEEEEED